MSQIHLALEDGWCPGPLFGPVVKRPAKRVRTSGGKEIWAKYRRALPPWATFAECRVFWDRSREMTLATGVQHSVNHIVPLVHPLVCGLHCPANLEVEPLADNIRRGNRRWPDMPEWQEELDL